MPDQSERMQILAMIEAGQISVDDGLKLLQALSDEGEPGEMEPGEDAPGAETSPAPPAPEEPSAPLPPIQQIDAARGEEVSPYPDSVSPSAGDAYPNTADEIVSEAGFTPPAIDPGLLKWRSWWFIPFWVGAGIAVFGGALVFLAWLVSGFSFWFACAWFPFLLGVAVLAFAWASRNMRWLHVRITQKDGDWPAKIAISLPLPIRFTAWLVRIFGSRIPHIAGGNLDQMVIALENTTPDAPFYVEVDEEGDHVEVFIG